MTFGNTRLTLYWLSICVIELAIKSSYADNSKSMIDMPMHGDASEVERQDVFY